MFKLGDRVRLSDAEVCRRALCYEYTPVTASSVGYVRNSCSGEYRWFVMWDEPAELGVWYSTESLALVSHSPSDDQYTDSA